MLNVDPDLVRTSGKPIRVACTRRHYNAITNHENKLENQRELEEEITY
jgi:hypothetical protein